MTADKSSAARRVKFAEKRPPDQKHGDTSHEFHAGQHLQAQRVISGQRFQPSHQIGTEETAQVGEAVEQRQTPGCRRTAQEIAAWPQMGDNERLRLMESVLPSRGEGEG